MCNLYSMTKPQDAIRAIFRIVRDRTGNLPPMPGIFPDYPAPIIRLADGDRELTTARWGMPSQVFARHNSFIASVEKKYNTGRPAYGSRK
jgi:putative SOS response-associated peptidase YedK